MEDIESFLGSIKLEVCPVCGACQTFVRHGYIRGMISPVEYGIRGWRIFCDPDSAYGAGCGYAPALWLSSTLLWRCFTSQQLQAFLMALAEGLSVYAAWRGCFSFVSLRTAYRLGKRLRLCVSLWRTHLPSRAPPPVVVKKGANPVLLQAYHHLQKHFSHKSMVSAFQHECQRHFLLLK